MLFIQCSVCRDFHSCSLFLRCSLYLSVAAFSASIFFLLFDLHGDLSLFKDGNRDIKKTVPPLCLLSQPLCSERTSNTKSTLNRFNPRDNKQHNYLWLLENIEQIVQLKLKLSRKLTAKTKNNRTRLI